jgi:ABC-type transport system involved in multi-copper enzyme maturation permease subunit
MSGPVRQLVEKDLRALLPTWGLFAVSLIITGRLIGPAAGLCVYLLGSTLLGALVVGHEYSHRTMAGLMALPIARHRVLLLKLAVLAVMLTAFAAVAALTGAASPTPADVDPAFRRSVLSGTLALVLPPLSAICIAPWLTMIGRSPLAGAVFACATLCMIWVAGQTVGFMRYGFDNGPFGQEGRLLATQIAWRGTLGACAIGIIGSWVTFARLQATEHLSLANVLPPWLFKTSGGAKASATTSAARRRHWIVNTISKEVRLQLMAFIVAGLYLVMWLVIVRTRPMLPEPMQVPLAPLTGLYGAIIGLLIGSFSSAEERHLGMLAWHSLMPVSARRQWIVKLLSVLGLAVALGAGGPWVLQLITADLSPFSDFMSVWQPVIVGAIAVASLYVSTLTSSGLRALVASVTVLGSGALVFSIVLRTLFAKSAEAFLPILRALGWYRVVDRELVAKVMGVLPAILIAVAVLWILWLAMRNHASAERSSRRARLQAVWLLGFCVCSTLALGALKAAAVAQWRYTGREGVRVTGRVEFEGTAPRPVGADLDMIWFSLEPEDHEADGGVTGLWKNGQLTTPYFYPDKYTARVPFTTGKWDKAWTLKRVTYQGRDITDTPIEIKTNLDDVVVTFTDRAGKIAGRVQAADGSDVAGMIAVMFPVDRAHWDDYGFTNRRIRAHGLEVDGSFSLAMPPSGDYYLAAIPRDRVRGLARAEYGNHWVLFRKDPSALFDTLSRSAQRIQAREGALLTPTLTVEK